jgi:choline dehydrogenase-like flavoprotein
LSHVGFARLANYVAPNPDTTPGSSSPHYEYIISVNLTYSWSHHVILIALSIQNGYGPGALPPTGNFLSVTTILLSPSSRGSIKLRSKNPFDTPIIDPALLKTSSDKLAMRESVKAASKFVTAPVWSGYVLGRSGSFADTTTDAKLDSYIAANSGTLFHPVGTASMSPRGARNGVTDPDLKVKKVSGLRIVDASVLVRTILFRGLQPLILIFRSALCSCWAYPGCCIRCRRKSFRSYQSFLHILSLNSLTTLSLFAIHSRTATHHNHSLYYSNRVSSGLLHMLIYVIYQLFFT